jgi:uncharacterized oligopeptide transporter (OPT) family protein
MAEEPHALPAQGLQHAIGSDRYPAPQGTLMATLIKGMLAHNLDWQFVLVGVFLAVTGQLCGVSPLSFAVGAYLPLSTTLPIFCGAPSRSWTGSRAQGESTADSELGTGSLFATGLAAAARSPGWSSPAR